MSLEQELNDTLKRAMLDKDPRTADVVRMVKRGSPYCTG